MAYAKQERIDRDGNRVESGDIATITTRDGSRITGEVSFNVAHADTAVVRKDGYTYIGTVRSMKKGGD